MSRKTSLTPEIQEKIVGLIKLGNYVDTTCKIVGIHKDTLYEWLKRGRTGEEPFATFMVAFEEAIGQAEAMLIAGIRAAGKEHWQAMAWMAERRFNKRWGRPERGDVDDADDSTDEGAKARRHVVEIRLSAPPSEPTGDDDGKKGQGGK